MSAERRRGLVTSSLQSRGRVYAWGERLVFVIHNDADGPVSSEVVDVPMGIEWVRVVPFVGEQEDKVIVVGSMGLVVHDLDVVAGCVCEEVDLDVFVVDGWISTAMG